jgi:hypothetical protein
MTSRAETVELLVRKAKFEPQVALAVADAIDNAMTDSQLVTVPILDARLAELREDFAKELAATREALSKEISATNERVGVMSERLMKEIHVTSERTRSDLARWVLLAMLGSTAIGIGATAVTNALQHMH